MQQYKNLSRAHFGSTSEKYADPNHPQQLLFDEKERSAEAGSSEEAEDPDGVVVSIAATNERRKNPIKRHLGAS